MLGRAALTLRRGHWGDPYSMMLRRIPSPESTVPGVPACSFKDMPLILSRDDRLGRIRLRGAEGPTHLSR